MSGALADALLGFQWFVLAYFVVLNSTYLLLLLLASGDVLAYCRRRGVSSDLAHFTSPLTPAVSVIVPAYNEEAGIAQSVRALLAQRHPDFEVVVVDDGATDDTFGVLERAFDLRETPRVVPDLVPTLGAVLSVHTPADGTPLTVIRKEGRGRKTDALNVGINASRHPLLCMVDADAVLDPDALLRVFTPFIEDPRVVATGGAVRAVNDSVVDRGHLEEPRLPRRWLARIQVVEYLRAFLFGRSGWSRIRGLLIISGAFGGFRRDDVIAVGGYDHTSIGEDADLVVRLHRACRDAGRDYRIVFVPEPVCWTEVPETRAVLARQRRRWSHGLGDTLSRNRAMFGRPRYGTVGTLAMPYYAVFELLGPVIELLGLLTLVLGLSLGIIDSTFAVLFLALAFGYGILLSVAAIATDQLSFHRYDRWRDLLPTLAAAVVENVGYRQLHCWWRLQGAWTALRGHEREWGSMERRGFATAATSPEAGDATSSATPPRSGPAAG
ncbi:MAG: glycosyltransferase family 2 protein [Acidimicrobiales bacterium]